MLSAPLAKKVTFALSFDEGKTAFIPPSGYFFLRGKNADGSYTQVSGFVSSTSRVQLAGKSA